MRRGADLARRQEPQLLRWAPFPPAPVAQCIERRASNAEAGGESPSGSANSSRNANRTSEPGLVANKIVPPPHGMRSMSSAFRHFLLKTRPCRLIGQDTRLSSGQRWVQIPPGSPFSFRSRSPTAEARRRERRQCGCDSCREHEFTPTGSIRRPALSPRRSPHHHPSADNPNAFPEDRHDERSWARLLNVR